MLLLEAKGLEKSYGSRKLLRDITLRIYSGDKIGLVGKNGVGKTTLLRILRGEDEDYSGEIERKALPSYLPQILAPKKGQLIEDFLMAEGHDYGRIIMWLNRFNMKKSSLSKRMDTCSGGELTRLHLVRIMASQRDLLLLDEPTNHLDLEMVEWLTMFIKEYRGSILIASHDRFLLNATTDVIWELATDGSLREYRGDYDSYLKKKEEEREREWQEYYRYQEEKKRIISSIKRQKEYIKKAHRGPKKTDSFWRLLKGSDRRVGKMAGRAPALKSRLEKLERKEKPFVEKEIEMDLAARHVVHSNILVEGRGIAKSFSKREVLRDLTFKIQSKAKIALTGANGVGKTVLLECIKGEMELDRGEIIKAKGVEIGYLSQQLLDFHPARRLIEEASLANPALDEETVRGLLGSLGFSGREVEKRVEYLSLGERARLGFGRLLLSKANLLLLDEPFNHLDIYLREVVEKSLISFPGTILMVTHDYYSIEQIASEIWELTPKGLCSFKGSFDEYKKGKRRGESKKKREGACGDIEDLVESMRRAVIAAEMAEERRKESP